MTDTSWTAAAGRAEPGLSDYVALLKPRVMWLVVFTALAGLVAAPVAVHPVIAVAALVCIAVGAGAAGALNMWQDRDIDAVMGRTRSRPIPGGRIAPGEALGFGLVLAVFSVTFLGLFANWVAAAILAFTIFFYAVVYSMWLKRATPQNIVIGGAAGAFPPLIGWAVATGDIGLEPVLLFLIIFLWTPPHFWALALFRNEDYVRAGVPMLPVVAGDRATRRQIALYAVILVPVAIAPAFTGIGGLVYLIGATILSLRFAVAALALVGRSAARAAADGYRAEKRLFGISILYLFAIFGLILVEAALAAVGLSGPSLPSLF